MQDFLYIHIIQTIFSPPVQISSSYERHRKEKNVVLKVTQNVGLKVSLNIAVVKRQPLPGSMTFHSAMRQIIPIYAFFNAWLTSNHVFTQYECYLDRKSRYYRIQTFSYTLSKNVLGMKCHMSRSH